ncbi:transcriptional regulator GcvA [Mesorhizobium xinjiangense]|uniref:transcriptional regulator GcvA n=1 Tax=Mesorhizobium xinjiangense TaxID=2678685 RepID=UPI0012EDB7DF|nr:transcriptional regulator GcvA [Mesorhizobium xinjiangense]
MRAIDLPPLAALRAFEAAARHGSFTKAAAELGMTQAAISYQIKVLEDRMGRPLFTRRPRQVSLTFAGRQLAPAVSDAFERIAAAYAQARGTSEGVLTVSVAQTFATHWLAPNLSTFQALHPDLAVRLESSQRMADFETEDVDLAVRSGAGNWPGLARHMLVGANFTPMLSPRLAESIGGVREPADLLRLPILDANDPWWTLWLEAAGVAPERLHKGPPSVMGVQALEARAAIAGRGVAILTPAFYRDEIEQGLLVQPFELTCSDGLAYWLVYPERRRHVPKIRAFRDWITKAVAEDRAMVTPR